MSPDPTSFKRKRISPALLTWILVGGLIAIAAVASIFAISFLKQLPIGQAFASQISWVFSNNSARTTWFITRSSAWVGYILLWLSTLWGLVLPTKIFDRFLSQSFTFDFHEYISLLAIGFIILHVTVLLFDSYLPFTVTQILLPFLSTYRPFWVGIGVLSMYITLLVTITFYLRKKIGQQKFRSIHTLSLLAFFGAALHGFFSGTDSSIGIAQIIYFSTLLPVILLTAFWLIRGKQIKTEKEAVTIRINR
jgi:sulfoxide reductase heme-binding subunit YedZ